MKKKFRILVRKFEPFEQITKRFWNQYKELSGVDLDLELVALPLPELHDAILKNSFDIAHVNTDWLAECWNEGVLENLAPYIKNLPPDDYPSGWHDALLKLQTFEDGIAGIPFHDGPECLIYRKDMFEDKKERDRFFEINGTELRPPKTWDEFIKIAQFFKRPEVGMYGTLFALYPDGHNNIFDFALQLWSRGGQLTDEADRIVLNSPEALEAMTFYRSLTNSGIIHPKSREFESINACLAFARSEAAMMVNWFGFATMGEAIEGSMVKGKVDIAAVPSGGNHNSVSLNVYYTWSVSTNSIYKKDAYNYIRNAVTAQNDKLLPFMGAVGCRRSTWTDTEVNEIIPFYHRMEEIHSYAGTLPRISNWHSVSVIIDRLVLDVVDTDKPIAEILRLAQNQIDTLMEEQHGRVSK
jgi:multiple sugar transport system substrate-binding protein